jgi:hypothetical protein
MMHTSASQTLSAGALGSSAGVGASFAVSASGARLKEKIVEFYESIFVKVPTARTPRHLFF